jgi:hypothetical protein
LCALATAAAEKGDIGFMKVNRNAPEPVPHSLHTDDPGRLNIDLWGWESTPFYQRENPPVVSPEFLKKRAVDESYKWGANILEIYRGGYPFEKREGWTLESTLDFNRYVHNLDMIIHWFPHRMGERSPQNAVDSVVDLGKSQMDLLNVDQAAVIDGIGTEQWSSMWPRLFNKCAWPFAPHLYFYTDNLLFATTLPNEQDVRASNGSGTDDQTGGGYYSFWERSMKEGGLQFFGSQAECRPQPFSNKFGGRGYPDWILKQINDQFRVKARSRGRYNVSPSAIWWISEAEDRTPDWVRPYVYGISMDPIRSACASQLTMLGKEGLTVGGSGLPQRFPYHSKTAFVQNNYLRLYQLHDRDETPFLIDPERVAHYDNNSHAVVISDNLLSTHCVDDEAKLEGEAEFTFTEPAGYVSQMQADLHWSTTSGKIAERRTFTLHADSPYMHLRIEFSGEGAAKAKTHLHLPHYQAAEAKDARSPVFVLEPSKPDLPELWLVLPKKGFLPEEAECGFVLTPSDGVVEAWIVNPDGLYTRGDVREAAEFLCSPMEILEVSGAGHAHVTNKLDIPVTKVIRVQGGDEHPFQVYEYGRWSFRGAQPSALHKGEDYLKVYLPPKGEALVQTYDFIEESVRPGWGCQYTVALRSAEKRHGGACARAEVRDITSFIYAPRLRFAHPIKSARVDGQPWHYFNDDHVFLPNRRGIYTVEVEYGEPETPRLVSTFADVVRTHWDGKSLSFEARWPEWTDAAPEDFAFMAAVLHPGQELASIENASVVRPEPGKGSIVRFLPGRVSCTFDANAAQNLPTEGVDALVERHLRLYGASHAAHYLDESQMIAIPVEALDAPDALEEFVAVFWHQYFMEPLPEAFTPERAAKLREFVRAGGGLFLGASALQAAPAVLDQPGPGGELLHLRSDRSAHRVSHMYEWLGLTPAAADQQHPLFTDLPRNGEDMVVMPLTESFEVAKRMVVPEEGVFAQPLARFAYEPKTEVPEDSEVDKKTAALWEWELGKGRIVGYGTGLRWVYGSPDKSRPHGETKLFISNVLRRICSEEGKIAVIW